LREAIKDRIDECREDAGKSWSQGLTRIRDALRALADEIDSALNMKTGREGQARR
jgi:hypothetical protein